MFRTFAVLTGALTLVLLVQHYQPSSVAANSSHYQPSVAANSSHYQPSVAGNISRYQPSVVGNIYRLLNEYSVLGPSSLVGI